MPRVPCYAIQSLICETRATMRSRPWPLVASAVKMALANASCKLRFAARCIWEYSHGVGFTFDSRWRAFRPEHSVLAASHRTAASSSNCVRAAQACAGSDAFDIFIASLTLSAQDGLEEARTATRAGGRGRRAVSPWRRFRPDAARGAQAEDESKSRFREGVHLDEATQGEEGSLSRRRRRGAAPYRMRVHPQCSVVAQEPHCAI
jgi:hypothetical protein